MTNPFANGLAMDETKTRRRTPGLTSDSSHQPGGDALAPPADADDPLGQPADQDDPLAAAPAEPKAVIPSFPGKGYCLAEPDLTKVAKRLIRMLDDYEELMPERRARWKVSDKRRRGIVGVQLLTERTTDDRTDYVVYVPPGSKAQAPTFNKLNRLCRRLKSNVFTDPFIPEATPGEATGSDDSEAAEFTTRALQAETGPSQLDLHKLGKRAFDLASTFDSGYAEFYLHPRAGGRQPKQIEASPMATTIDDAIFRTVSVPVTVPSPDGAIGPDGQPVMVPDPTQPPQQMQVPQPGPYVMRYVAPGGQLTDDRKEAERVWMPRLRASIYPARQTRLLPANCSGIEEAEVVLIGDYVTLGELRERLQYVREMTAERLRKMIAYQPKHPRDFLPAHLRRPKPIDVQPRGEDDADENDPLAIPDQTHVFVLKAYFRDVGEYEDGGYLLIGGDTEVLHRQPLVEVVDDEPVRIPVPIAQMKQFDDGTEDPEGRGAAHILGSGNEVRGALVGNLIEALYRINTAKTFYTPSSMFQPKAGSVADLYMPIEQGTAPVKEQVPQPPQVAYSLLEMSGAEMDDEIGLSPVAQGESPPSVQSGLHAQTLIEQTLVGLSDVKQNVTDFYLRSWRIMLAIMRAYYPPQLLQQYLGDDQPHKLDSWMGAQLSTNVDMRLLAGSGTMLAPSAKMAVGEYAASLGMLDQSQLRRIWIGNAGGLIGAQDDPHLARVERQIRRFLKGPPKEVDPSQWPAMLADIWAISPVDEEPPVATLRHDELARMVVSTRFTRLAAEWQVPGVAEYTRMRYAAGIYTLAEQQQMQAQAAAAAAMQPGTGGGGGGPASKTEGAPASPATAQPTQSALAPTQGGNTPLAA